MNNWHKAFRLARRELRGGTKGFRIFLACLILGVTTIAAVGSLNQSISIGLDRDGRALLGGDLDIRLSSREITDTQRNFMQEFAEISTVTELRAMAQNGDKRQLVELKAVDDLYPLAGTVVSAPPLSIDQALANHGILLDANLLTRLEAKVGDQLSIGQTTVTISGTIEKEPDRIASVINFGPRVLMSQKTLQETGLILPGSVYRNHYRLALNDISNTNDIKELLNIEFPEAGWRIRASDNAAPGVENFINRLTLFLNFVGFTTLLIGGVGVSSGVRDFIASKTHTIATFKSLGASGRLIFQTYFLQLMALSFVGIAIGLFFGGSVPYLAATIGSQFFPVAPEGGIYMGALFQATAFGLLSVLTFALWPLGQSHSVAARALFRDKSSPIHAQPPLIYKIFSTGSLLLLIILTIITAHRIDFAVVFIFAAGLIFLLLRILGKVTISLAAKSPRLKSTSLRLAIQALHKPGTNAPSVILSLGLGLSVLVAVTQIDQNLRGQITENLPKQAPTFFFIDIQNEQSERLDQTFANIKGTADYKRMPSLRGRITEINGVSVDKVTIAPESQWAVRGDRALTYARTPSEGSVFTKGSWWDADYSGPPLISLDSGLATGFGVDIGDTLTVNVLGRDVTATITSLRDINWRQMRFDFAIIMSPGLLEYAPHSHIAAIHADDQASTEIEQTLAKDFPNVSIIRVKEALESAGILMDGISNAIAMAASLTVLAGALVLAGAMSSGREQRTYEAIIYKVIGVTRLRLLQSYLIEYGVLGLLTGFISIFIGAAASWGVIIFLMDMQWAFYADSAAITLILCLILTIGAGFLGTWSALGQKAAPYLRNE